MLDIDEHVVDIACGALFTIILTSRGRVFGCGHQMVNSLDTSDNFLDKARFKNIVIDDAEIIITKISAGLSGAAVLTEKGFVFCWGKFGKKVDNLPKKVVRNSRSINDKPDEEKYISVCVGDEFILILSQKG